MANGSPGERRPRSEAPMTRRHIWIEDEQWLWLRERFGGSIGVSMGIRMILAKFKSAIEAKAAERARPASELEEIGDEG